MAATHQHLLPHPSPHQVPYHHHHHHHLLSLLAAPTTTFPQLKQLHAHILRTGLDRSPSLLANLLIAATNTSHTSTTLDYALAVFNQTSNQQIHLCNRILRHLSRSAQPEKALSVYRKMREQRANGVDRFTFPPLLKAMARVSALREGMEVHGVASKMGFDSDPFVQTGLVGFYAANGRVLEARLIFDKMLLRDVVTWNVMIEGYCQGGYYHDVFVLFEEMRRSGVEPDKMILATMLSACSRSRNLNYGKAIHDYICSENLELDFHLQSALITMYANCGLMDMAEELYGKMKWKNLVAATSMVMGYSRLGKVEAARSMFDDLLEKDLVAWSAMIAGYAESDRPQEALNLFDEMEHVGIKPDQVTLLSVISACAQLGVMDKAKWIHNYIDKNGFGNILAINNALIDMYAKCGSLANARNVFDKMSSQRNVISWTSMITGLAMHGDANGALALFDQMKANGVEPNNVTFVGVLYACSHVGLVDQGSQIFASMINDYNIAPMHEHYGCMVDLFGRANLLREALELIKSMPFPPNVVVWGSLLSACRVHGEVELGEFAAKQLLKLDPEHDGAHVLLSNIYAKAKRWGDVAEVRKMMKTRGVSKEKGCSRIELDGEVHEFFMFDRTHKQADEIYKKLDEVVSKLKLEGYVPNLSSVLVDLEDEEKKEVVLWHSEKLALCYGLLKAGKESCIHIVKNIRVCEDCHTFIKLVSKVFEKEIIVRDRSRFHHYKDGVCSCKDYW